MENIGRKLKHKVHFTDKQTHHKNWQFCWVSLFDIERGFFLSEQLSLQEQMRKFPNYFSTKLSSIAGVDCHMTRLRLSCFLLYFWLWFLSSADSWKGLDFLFFPLIILTLIFVRITKEHRVCRPLNRAITWWSEIANTSWFPRQLLNWVPCQHSLRLFQTKLEGIFRLVAQPFFNI